MICLNRVQLGAKLHADPANSLLAQNNRRVLVKKQQPYQESAAILIVLEFLNGRRSSAFNNMCCMLFCRGGSVCALCYCGEKSLLGQGDITRYSPSPGFNPFKKPPLRARGSRDILYGSSPGSTGSQESFLAVEKVTKTAAQRRGSKQM